MNPSDQIRTITMILRDVRERIHTCPASAFTLSMMSGVGETACAATAEDIG